MSSDTQSPFTSEIQRYKPSLYHSISFIVSIVVAQRALFILSVILLVLSSLGMVAGPWIIGLLIDALIAHSPLSTIYLIVVSFAVVEFLRLFASAIHAYTIARLGQESLDFLRKRVMAHIQRLPMQIQDRTRTGELMTLLSNDVQALSNMFSTAFMAVLEKILVVICTVIALFLISPKLAMLGLSLFFVLFIAAGFITPLLKRMYHEQREANAEFSSALSENIEGMPIIRLNQLSEHRMRYFNRVNERVRASQLGPVKVFGVLHPSVTLVNAFSIALLSIFGGEMVIEGTLSVGTLVAAFGYILWMFWPIIIIIDRFNVFLNGLSSAERLLGLFALQTEEIEKVGRIDTREIKGEIIFEHVWFAYQEPRWVIRDLSLRIPAGERVAFFGPTGSGKTTLAALLLRLYTPQRGRILLDGVDIQTIPLGELRQIFGIIQQDLAMFEGSIEENIALFSEKKVDIQSPTLQLVSAKDQSSLSMGERQIIAFERAKVHSPMVWILDEATAHLDPSLDRELEERLIRTAYGKTVIVIAHRMSSFDSVDRIFVLRSGVLIEEGSRTELIEAQGFFARYISLQQEFGSGA